LRQVLIVVLPALHVEVDQRGNHLVSLGQVGHVVEEAGNRVRRLFLLDQRVLGDCLVEVVGGGIDNLFRDGRLQGIQSFFVDAAIGQRLGVSQRQVGAEIGRALGVAEQGGDLFGSRRGGIARFREQFGGIGITQRERGSHPVEQRRVGRVPNGGKRRARRSVRFHAVEPGLGLRAGGIESRRLERAEGVNAGLRCLIRPVGGEGRGAERQNRGGQESSRVHQTALRKVAIAARRRPCRWRCPSWPSESSPGAGRGC